MAGLAGGRLYGGGPAALQPTHQMAVVCGSYCGPEAVALCRVATPRITQSDQLLVRVMAGSLDPADLLATSGWARLERGRAHGGFPLGRDFCGVVVEAGAKVSHLHPGDRVWGALPYNLPGALAEQIVVPGNLAVPLPSNLSWEGAATVPHSALQVSTARLYSIHSGKLCDDMLLSC